MLLVERSIWRKNLSPPLTLKSQCLQFSGRPVCYPPRELWREHKPRLFLLDTFYLHINLPPTLSSVRSSFLPFPLFRINLKPENIFRHYLRREGEGVQKSSIRTNRHPNAFCGMRAPQWLIFTTSIGNHRKILFSEILIFMDF